ncbi:MAG: peptidylprolyl isomerase [Bacteroidota bacterium]
MKLYCYMVTLSCLIALSSISVFTQQRSDWQVLLDNKENGLSGRYYTTSNSAMGTGYCTHYEIMSRYQSRVYFTVTFTYYEGDSKSWDWNLSSGKSYEWNLDTKGVTNVRIQISNNEGGSGEDQNATSSNSHNQELQRDAQNKRIQQQQQALQRQLDDAASRTRQTFNAVNSGLSALSDYVFGNMAKNARERMNNERDNAFRELKEKARTTYGDLEDCSSCSGSGAVDCSQCNSQGYSDCSNCNGTGKQTCNLCGGTGTFFNKPCTSCGGRGYSTCAACSGKGKIICIHCGGVGKTNCTSCKGTGKIFVEKDQPDEQAGTTTPVDNSNNTTNSTTSSSSSSSYVASSFITADQRAIIKFVVDSIGNEILGDWEIYKTEYHDFKFEDGKGSISISRDFNGNYAATGNFEFVLGVGGHKQVLIGYISSIDLDSLNAISAHNTKLTFLLNGSYDYKHTFEYEGEKSIVYAAQMSLAYFSVRRDSEGTFLLLAPFIGQKKDDKKPSSIPSEYYYWFRKKKTDAELCKEYYDKALAYKHQGDLDNAIEYFAKALFYNPNDTTTLYNMGYAYRDKNKYDKAMECYQKVIDIAPDNASAYFDMGLAHGHEKEYDKAIECYEKALRIKPNYAEAYFNIGNMHHARKEYDQAVICYRKATEIKPEYAEASANMSADLENVLQDMYEKRKEEIRAQHILISLKPDASDDDTLAAWSKAFDLLKRAKNGESFDSLAYRYSDDSTAKFNHGDVYYFTSGMMVSAFEKACYNLKKEEIFPVPVRTPFGYHIIKVLDRIHSRGSIKASHIMTRFKGSATDSEDNAQALQRITALQDSLKRGADFHTLAMKYSEDGGSAAQGGDLGWFERRKWVQSFDEAVFKLNVGQNSDIVKTPFGYHIIKCDSMKPVGTYQELRNQLLESYNKVAGISKENETQSRAQSSGDVNAKLNTGAEQKIQSNKDAIMEVLKSIAHDAYEYLIRPSSMGGGGGSYAGFSISSSLSSDDNGTYTVAAGVTRVMIVGTSHLDARNIITLYVDSNGTLTSWTYEGDFK